MEKPCEDCRYKLQSKNNKKCVDCKKRIDYANFITKKLGGGNGYDEESATYGKGIPGGLLNG